MDTVALSALILSILGLVGGLVLKLHLSHCKSGCFESDCTNNNDNNENTPINTQPKLSVIGITPIEVVV